MRWLIVLLVGGVVGALCDQIHVQTHTLAYAHPFFLGQSWWVAPQFGLAAVGLLAGAGLFARWAAAIRPSPPDTAELVAGTAWFLGAYLASGLLGAAYPRGFAVALAVLFGVRLALRKDWVPVGLYALILAVCGSAYEGTLSSTGAFWYLHPDLYHVPWWLPGLYLHGAPAGLALARVMGKPGPVTQPG